MEGTIELFIARAILKSSGKMDDGVNHCMYFIQKTIWSFASDQQHVVSDKIKASIKWLKERILVLNFFLEEIQKCKETMIEHL